MGCSSSVQTSRPPLRSQRVIVPHHPLFSPVQAAIAEAPREENAEEKTELPTFERPDTTGDESTLHATSLQSVPLAISSIDRGMPSSPGSIGGASSHASFSGKTNRFAISQMLRNALDFIPAVHFGLPEPTDFRRSLAAVTVEVPAFMFEDETGAIVCGSACTVNSAGELQMDPTTTMRALLQANAPFERPPTPAGVVTKEPSAAYTSARNKVKYLQAVVKDRLHSGDDKEEPPDVTEVKKEKEVFSRKNGQSPILSPRSPLQNSRRELSNDDRPSWMALSGDDEFETSTLASFTSSASMLTPITPFLDTSSRHSRSPGAGSMRAVTPPQAPKAIQTYRQLAESKLTKSERKLNDRVSAWLEHSWLTTLTSAVHFSNDEAISSRSTSIAAVIPLTQSNLQLLQSQIEARRDRIAQSAFTDTTYDDYFMSLPAAVCWYYGHYVFMYHPSEVTGDRAGASNSLAHLYPPCLLRHPFHAVYGFAATNSSDLSKRAAGNFSVAVKNFNGQ